MRILLDECVHAGLREAFPGHVVRTVSQVGWSGASDSSLLLLAQGAYDVFVTVDRKLEHQHKLKDLRLGVLIVRVVSNELHSYRPLFEALLNAAEAIRPGEVVHIPRL